MPEGSAETEREHIARLVELITRTRTLFLSDAEMTKVLGKLDGLVGATFDFLDKTGKEPHVMIEEIRSGAENKIKEIEKSLY